MPRKIWYDICYGIKRNTFQLEATSSKTRIKEKINWDIKNKINYIGTNSQVAGVQEIVNYAYKISSWNMDFLWTITHESKRNYQLQSNITTSNWNREKSFWLCQRNVQRYSDIINDKRFKDPLRQIEICRNKYKLLDDPWTIFHWYYKREQHFKEFII